MRLVAYDPFVSADRARQMGVELLSLDQAVAESDFLTIHLPKTKETTGLINRDLLLKAKPTLRVINVARGGIVDEADLAEAIRDGVIAGAALDVFATEPMTESPLFELDAGRRHAAPRGVAPARRRTRPATRSPTWCSWRSPASSCRSPSTSTRPRPTRRCGRSCRSPSGSAGCSPRWSARLPQACSRSAPRATSPATTPASSTLAALKGFFGAITDEPVTYVNAPQLAKDHGVEVREVNCATSADYVNLHHLPRRRALVVAARWPAGAASSASS